MPQAHAMTLPRGMAFEVKQVVPVAPPPDKYFDDVPEPIQASIADSVELLRAICDLLDGPAKSTAARVAALRRIAGRDKTPLREAARKASCSPATLLTAKRAIEQALKLNTFSEGKSAQN
jgi:hypothetical protein